MKLNFTEEHLKVGGPGIKVTGYNKDVYKIKRPFPISFDLYLPNGSMLCFSGLNALKNKLMELIKDGAS